MERVTCIFIILIFIGHICSCVADCSINTTGVYRFGSDCQHVCHCYSGSVCDKDTGVCPNKCATNWFGPACQKRDIAEEQLSRHSSNLQENDYQFATKANDGDTTTCSHTMEAHRSTKAPWWKVLFPRNETIREVFVLTKTDILQYFPNFEVSVEFVPKENKDDNSYIPEYKRTCYRHDATVPGIRPDLDPDTDPDTSMIYVQCEQPEVGNQVRIKLAEVESQLVLCDLRISKECPDNKWGPLCEYSCGACRIGTCDVVTGTCYGGCQDGFENTDFCTTECIYGRYSFGCCSVNCMTQPCNKVNGECIGGCKDGYRGNRCEQECKDGTYGNGCNNVCSGHCSNVCNKVTGTCSCMAGYKGILCDEECDRGTFGIDCTSQCNSKCPNTCDKVTGYCPECSLGWKGHYCETECDYGTYGLNCTAECGHCQTNTFCHKVTGICESGCMKGYTGTTCHDAEEDPEVPTPLPIAMIAGTSVGVVAIICVTVVVVCVVMYKRRQMQSTSSTTKGQMELATNSTSSSYVNLQRNDRMNDTTYETINHP